MRIYFHTCFFFLDSSKLDQSTIDLTVVRLCFQVFLPDNHHRFQRHVPAVVSQCIFDKSEYGCTMFIAQDFLIMNCLDNFYSI